MRAVILLLLVGCGTRHRCELATTWEAGDQHYNERLMLRDDGDGEWTYGGFADDIPGAQLGLRWHASGRTLDVRSRIAHRQVGYRLEPLTSDSCMLVFDDSPILGDRSGFTHFTSAR